MNIKDRKDFEVEDVSHNMHLFRTRIIHLRKERHLTQEQLSLELGVTRSSLAAWETGTRIPDALTLRTISHFFNVSSDFLIGLTNEKHRFLISSRSRMF